MSKLHQIQLNILRTLLFARSKRYSEIKPADMEGSQFKFHMDKLITGNLISKSTVGVYVLTSDGKELANQMDSTNICMRKQAKVSAKICCTRNKDSVTEFLLYKREKNPFYGFQGFPNSKIWYGSSLYEGAMKGLFDETGLTGTPELFAIRHYIVLASETEDLLEDKVVYMFKVVDPEGVLKSKKDGLFKWVKESDLKHFVSNPLPEYKEVVHLLTTKDNFEFFKEVTHLVSVNNF